MVARDWEQALQESVNVQTVVLNHQKLGLYHVGIQNALNVKLHFVDQNNLNRLLKKGNQ